MTTTSYKPPSYSKKRSANPSAASWWGRFITWFRGVNVTQGNDNAKLAAKNRLKLVLMHDRSQLSPTLMEQLRDELVHVISKYVEIDQKALDLYLEQESNNIALVANIGVIRAKGSLS